MLHIKFTTDLGAVVTVDASSVEEVVELQCRYGRMGWYSGEVPSGGFIFPLENESDFDWALIGGRKITTKEGDEVVICRGYSYKRRELEAVETKKLTMPKAVKYSRGAKPTDALHLREKADGDIEYVTLAIFRGGRRQDRYAESAANVAPARSSAPPVPERQPAPPAPSSVRVMDTSGFAELGGGPTLEAEQVAELRTLLAEVGFDLADTAGRKTFLEQRLGRSLKRLNDMFVSEFESERVFLRTAKGKAEVRAFLAKPAPRRGEVSGNRPSAGAGA